MTMWGWGVPREWGRVVGESLVNRRWGRGVSCMGMGEYLVKGGGRWGSVSWMGA
jgi:hypothetical protein